MKRLITYILFFFSWGLQFSGNAQSVTKKAPTPLISNRLATDYYEFVNKVMQTIGIQPTELSRVFGYMGLTLYESLVPGMPACNSLVGQLNGLHELPQPNSEQSYYWEMVANAAMKSIIEDLVKSQALGRDEYLNYQLYNPIRKIYQEHDSLLKLIYKKPDIQKRSVAYGDTLAKFIFSFSKKDGGYRSTFEELRADYSHYQSPPNATWHDSLTKAGISLQPTWGKNRTFIKFIDGIAQAAPPYPISADTTSIYYQQAKEVYELYRKQTFEQRVIAEYWKDNPSTTFTPPGHSMSILTQLLQEQNSSLEFTAIAYAKMGFALSDAFVCCWKTKYETNCVRPINYIRKYIDVRFVPSITTPPFPEYTSGHSVQAGAASEVLTNLFGNNFAFTDKTLDRFQISTDKRYLVNRSFPNFYAMAEESSMSRVYGGIHYRQACEVGVSQGRIIGREINNLKWKK